MIEATLAAALLVPALSPAPAPAQEALFPPAREAMVVTSGPDGEKFTYYDLVRQYAESTDQDVTMTEDTANMLRSRVVGLSRAVEVPADKVQHTFETLLLAAGFVLAPPQVPDVPIFRVSSLYGQERSSLRANTTFLTPDQIPMAEAHPAVLFTVTLDLPNTDVRQLSNSMRTLITDANTQQLLPAGNSNSVVMVGFGEQIAGMARTLRIIDEAAGRERMALERRVQVISLAHADATELANICGLVFEATGAIQQGPVHQGAARPKSLLIVPDARTNSLVVRGTAAEQERVAKLVAELDKASPKGK